jgi:predicted solute-binding protein
MMLCDGYCDKYDACDEYYDIYDVCDEYYEMHIMPVIFGYF